MKKIFIAIASIAPFFAACSKHKDDVEDSTPKATIEYASPAQGAVYNFGDSVLVQATATSTATIHGYDLIIRKTEDTSRLYFNHFHDHKASLLINSKWKANVSNSTLVAEVILYLDHDGHTATKKVPFKIN